MRVFSEELLSHAQAHPLTTEELESCFLKTDTLPLDVSFEKITLEGEVFLAKSRLNALRRAFYEKLVPRAHGNMRAMLCVSADTAFFARREK